MKFLKYVVIIGITNIILAREIPTLKSWEMFRLNLENNAVSYSNDFKPPLKLKWRYKTGHWIIASPVVVEGKVYIGSLDGYLYVLDSYSGKLKQKYTTQERHSSESKVGQLGVFSRLYPTSIIKDGIAYYGDYGSKFYAQKISTGQFLWEFKTNGHRICATSFYDDGIVYCADEWFYAIEAKTGKEIWRYEIAKVVEGIGEVDPWVFSSPKVKEGIVYFGGNDDYLYALDSKNGSLIWRYKTGAEVTSSPVIQKRIIFFGSADTYVYALDTDTGSLVWRHKTEGPVLSSSCLYKNLLFIGSEDGNLYAFKLDGQLKWKYQTKAGVFSTPCVCNNVVYFGSDDGNIYGIDILTGELKWRAKTNDAVRSSPCIVNNILYIGSLDGYLYAFEITGRKKSVGLKLQETLKKPVFERVKHPNLFINSDEFFKIKEKIEKYTWVKQEFEKLKRKADEFVGKKVQIPLNLPEFSEVYPKKYEEIDEFQKTHLDLIRDTLYASLVYQITGEEVYAKKAKEVLLKYAEVYGGYRTYFYYEPDKPIYGKILLGCGKISGDTQKEAAHLINFCWIYDLIYDYLTPEERGKITVNLIVKMGKIVARNFAGISSWNCWHLGALGIAGLTINYKTWLNKTQYGFENFLKEVLISPTDVIWQNQSLGLEPLNKLALAYKHYGINLYKNKYFKKMFDFPFEVLMPNGELPAFGNSWKEDLPAEIYEIAYAVYKDPKYATVLKNRNNLTALLHGEGVINAFQKIKLPQGNFPSGWGILRQGNNYLAINCTKPDKAQFSGHFDKLGIVFCCGKEVLGIDPGNVSNTELIQDLWYRTTIAHNTIVVDQKSQQNAKAKITKFKKFKQFSGLIAKCRDAYPGIELQRLIGLTKEYFVVIDKAIGDQEHIKKNFVVIDKSKREYTYEFVYHNRGYFSTGLPMKKIVGYLNEKNGYQHIEEVKYTLVDDDWNCQWEVGKTVVKLNFLGEKGTKLYTGLGLGNPSTEKNSMIIVQRKAKETVYIAVFDIQVEGKENIEQIEKIKDKNDNLIGINIQLKNGNYDKIYFSFEKDKIDFRRN